MVATIAEPPLSFVNAAVQPEFDTPDGGPAAARVMALLRAGVPLSLLADLCNPAGPDSLSIMLREGGRPVVAVPDPTD